MSVVRVDIVDGYTSFPTMTGSIPQHVACGLLVGDKKVHNRSCPAQSEEDRLTYALQALGPDEFPEAYYRHLAQERLSGDPECRS